jgi:PTH1 family peptidyl-tRNA hydrolase
MKPSLLIIGLGNVGREYENTRHNAGFLMIDMLAKKYGTGEWKEEEKFDSFTAEITLDGTSILLAKPTTFMNRSGDAIQKIITFYKLNPVLQLLILVDDLDIPLGTIRFRESGGAGTHNGLKSIAALYGENFPRLRLGIGPKSDVMELSDWVLAKMNEEEKKTLLSKEKEVEEQIMKRIKALKDNENE